MGRDVARARRERRSFGEGREGGRDIGESLKCRGVERFAFSGLLNAGSGGGVERREVRDRRGREMGIRKEGVVERDGVRVSCPFVGGERRGRGRGGSADLETLRDAGACREEGRER